MINADYILARVRKLENGCWNWQQGKNRDGYGRARQGKKELLAHRLSYMVFCSDIPDGMEVDHLCWNRACCNPEHLRILTPSEHRGCQQSAMKLECVNGHLLYGENLYLRPNGMRDCRQCIRDRVRRYKKRKRMVSTV